MSKFFKAIGAVVLAAALAFGGFTVGKHKQYENISQAMPKAEVQQKDEPSEIPKHEEDGGLYIGKTNSSQVTVADHVVREFDITLANEPAKLKLYTSAEYIDGEFNWDDSQKWVVEVEQDGGVYPLYSDRVSLGNVYTEYIEGNDGEAVVMVYVMTSSGTKINKYTFSESGFLEKTVYDSGAVNSVQSSIPQY